MKSFTKQRIVHKRVCGAIFLKEFYMNKLRLIILFVILLLTNSFTIAQWENINFRSGEYIFQTKYDTSAYKTLLRIKKNKKLIFKETYDDRISEIKGYDLNNDGKKEILIDMYTGGAHCCTSLFVGEIRNDNFNFIDTIFWGNSYYSVKDLNNDCKYEILGANDMFAYAFTNFAESEFPILIYGMENKRIKNITGRFPKLVEENITDLMEKLQPYTTDSGFVCPVNENEDTFNTDAGAVKAILAR